MMTSLIIMRQLGGEGEKHKTSMIKKTDKMAPKSQGAHNTHDWWSERDNSQKISIRKGQLRIFLTLLDICSRTQSLEVYKLISLYLGKLWGL